MSEPKVIKIHSDDAGRLVALGVHVATPGEHGDQVYGRLVEDEGNGFCEYQDMAHGEPGKTFWLDEDNRLWEAPPVGSMLEDNPLTVAALLEHMRLHDKDGRLKPTVPEPSEEEIERMTLKSVHTATDGCRVEPDGACPHGHMGWPAWKYGGV